MNESKAGRYHRLQRRAAVAALGATTGLLLLLVVTPASRGLATAATHLTAGWPGAPLAAAALYAAALVLIVEFMRAPLHLYAGFALERRFGLSRQTLSQWTADHLKGLALGGGLTVFVAVLVTGLIHLSPEWWWLLAALCLLGAIVVLAHAAPVLLLPLFYDVRPLERPALAARLEALAAKAGVPVVGVFEWRLGEKSRRANAALAGLGSTRRILLSDTLLDEYSDDEIEVVLAHELAHHVHHDIWSGLAVEAAVITVGAFAADRVVREAGPWFGVSGASDLAALPVLALTAGALSLALGPVAKWVSRQHERRADAFALKMTGAPEAFISAMRRLAAQNLAEEAPSAVVRALFHTHPPMEERVARARALTTGERLA